MGQNLKTLGFLSGIIGAFFIFHPLAFADLSSPQFDYFGWQILDGYGIAKLTILLINLAVLLLAILSWKYLRHKKYVFILVGAFYFPLRFAYHTIHTYQLNLARWPNYGHRLLPWQLWGLKIPLYISMIFLGLILLTNLLYWIQGEEKKARI